VRGVVGENKYLFSHLLALIICNIPESIFISYHKNVKENYVFLAERTEMYPTLVVDWLPGIYSLTSHYLQKSVFESGECGLGITVSGLVISNERRIDCKGILILDILISIPATFCQCE
jgi:hypothetical protein